MAAVDCCCKDVTEKLYDVGYNSQCNVDFSHIAIAAMENKYKHLTGLQWRVMDVRKLEYPDASFEVAFDKARTV